jgi:hypothetical protein
MFTQETVSTECKPAFDGDRTSGIATDSTALGGFDWKWPSMNTFVPLCSWVAHTRAPLTAPGASR